MSANTSIRCRTGDNTLIEKIITGNNKASEHFVARYSRCIYALLASRGYTRDELEDIHQDIFVHLWDRDRRCLRQWRGDAHSRFSSFLGMVAVRTALDYRRRQDRTVSRHTDFNSFIARDRYQDQETTDIHNAVETRQQFQAAEFALNSLKSRDIALIHRRHYNQETYAEIGLALGMTANHVGVALLRAEQRLRARLLTSYPELFDA